MDQTCLRIFHLFICGPVWIFFLWEESSFLIGESPSNCPYLQNNGDKAPKGPSSSFFQEWTGLSPTSNTPEQEQQKMEIQRYVQVSSWFGTQVIQYNHKSFNY